MYGRDGGVPSDLVEANSHIQKGVNSERQGQNVQGIKKSARTIKINNQNKVLFYMNSPLL